MQDSGAASIDFDKSRLGTLKTRRLLAPREGNVGNHLVSKFSHSFTQGLV
jgi:hypothetical protein